MKIRSLTLVYFPPAGTTRMIAERIALGIDQGAAEILDGTPIIDIKPVLSRSQERYHFLKTRTSSEGGYL